MYRKELERLKGENARLERIISFQKAANAERIEKITRNFVQGLADIIDDEDEFDFVLDSAGIMLYVSRRAVTKLGYGDDFRRELIGMHHRKVFGNDITCFVSPSNEKIFNIKAEVSYLGQDGSEIVLLNAKAKRIYLDICRSYREHGIFGQEHSPYIIKVSLKEQYEEVVLDSEDISEDIDYPNSRRESERIIIPSKEEKDKDDEQDEEIMI